MHEDILSRFAVPGKFLRSAPFGNGLINETFLSEFEDAGIIRKYILQRINTKVFTRPEQVMENVELVTRHLQKRLRAEGIADPESTTPALVRTKDGGSFFRDAGGGFWRMFHFIETGAVYDTVRNAEHAFEVGRALGRFQYLTSDLDPHRLNDTLPGFHHTPLYLERFEASLQQASKERLRESRDEIALVDKNRGIAPLLTGPMQEGAVPVRVTHNDPKVNNVMVDARTGKALCMLDLDTVKPGSVLFDFGDCVRSVANPPGEDAERPNDAVLDPEFATAITRGYLREAGSILTPKEIELLPLSVGVIAFELGVRFLTDFLLGDVYFKIKYPGHNLHRARVQLYLFMNRGRAEGAMKSEIEKEIRG